MAAAAEMALEETGGEGGMAFVPMRADRSRTDAAAATTTAERLVDQAGAVIVGVDCSGATGAVLADIAAPRRVAMISPSATSSALSDVEDGDLFLRTAPSDARQGEVLAQVAMDCGLGSVAVTYIENR